MDIRNSLIPILCIGCMLIGVLFAYLFPKGDKRRDKANIVFVFAAAILVANWLIQEPTLLLFCVKILDGC
jgi:hypothetical protein